MIVDEPVLGVFVANVLELGLNRVDFCDDFRGHVAILQFESWGVLAKVCVGLRAPGFDDSNFQPGFGQTLACPASGSS